MAFGMVTREAFLGCCECGNIPLIIQSAFLRGVCFG